MLTCVEFCSDIFPPYDGEEEEINPGLWGKRLAEFLRNGLRGEGFVTKELIAEDWGWVVPIVNAEFPIWIGCGRYQEYPDGFLCFIQPHKPSVRRLLKTIDTQGRVAELQKAMDKVLMEQAGIRAKRWWTYEEFNKRALGIADPGKQSRSR
jgi:hypothetical protein